MPDRCGPLVFLQQARDGYAKLCDSVAMPLIRMLDAERAHSVAVWAASLGLAPKVIPRLATEIACHDWGNPLLARIFVA